jgi:hypothetical protein
MDHAAQNASEYIARHPDVPPHKLTARIKSELRRRAKQLSAWRNHEFPCGSIDDLEHLLAIQPDIEQRIYANELFAHLSPFAQKIAHWRSLGYSWRKIERTLEMDHTLVERAYFRELKSLLRDLSRPGDSQKCD